MRTISYLFFGLFGLLFACNDGPAEANNEAYSAIGAAEVEEEVLPANMAPEFVAVLDAHGGLTLWNDYEAASFLLRDFPTGHGDTTLTDFHRVNLGSREHAVEGEGYTVVSDGTTTWASPNLNVTGFPPRMYQAASFYLFGMPFVFADAGMTITNEGEATFGEDETMLQFNVQVPDGMGDGGNDYQLYVDPTTKQLRYATWNLQYPTLADQNLRQMVEFNEWQDAEGLNVPAVITLYTAPNDIEPGTPGVQIAFERVAFSSQPFASEVFERPEDGIVDESYQGK